MKRHDSIDLLLEDLAAPAESQRPDWDDVLARARVLTQSSRSDDARRSSSDRGGKRTPRRLVLALAGAALLVLAGTAIGVGSSLLDQQGRFHATAPDDPDRLSPLVEIASGEKWALIAWKSESGVCLDYAVPGNSAFGCGWRVPGALPPDDPSRGGLPFQVVHGAALGGGGFVGGDGMTAIVGVAAAAVTALEVEIADGRIIAAPLYDAPADLGVGTLRFFVLRVRLPTEIDYGRANPVRAFRAYDSERRLIARVVSD